MGEKETERIRKLLEDSGADYKIFRHEPVYTSEQAAKVRGVELKRGVKALVFKTGSGEFILALVSADRRVDEDKLVKVTGVEELELADPEEVLDVTGCEIGSVHPFGMLYGLDSYMDRSILENEYVDFNAGQHEVSVEMRPEDLVKIIGPKLCDIS